MAVHELGNTTIIGDSINVAGGRRPYPIAPSGKPPVKRTTPVVTARAAALLAAFARRRAIWKSIADLNNTLIELRATDPRIPEVAGRTLHALLASFVRHGLVEAMITRPKLYLLKEHPRDEHYARHLLDAVDGFGYGRPHGTPTTSIWKFAGGSARG